METLDYYEGIIDGLKTVRDMIKGNTSIDSTSLWLEIDDLISYAIHQRDYILEDMQASDELWQKRQYYEADKRWD